MKVIFEDKDKVYTINEIAQVANIHPQTLRNWEKYGIIKPQRLKGNQRVFMREDLERIEKICQWKEEGYNIKAIKLFLGENE